MDEAPDFLSLREKERELATLMSTLPGMAYRCSFEPEWTMSFVSEGCESLTGYPAGDLVHSTRLSYATIIHPDDKEYVWNEVSAAIEDDRMFRISYRIISAAGDIRWVYEQGRAYIRPRNEPVIEGFITDITDQKNTEAALQKSLNEKTVLLGEVHHRVKNNMQLVISLLELQPPKIECRDQIKKIIDRIRIFSDIHEQLYNSGTLSEIDIAQQIEQIFVSLNIAGHGDNRDVSLVLDIPDPLVVIDEAIPIGLMINELMTNSLKYAFGGECGIIKIALKKKLGKVEFISYTDDGCMDDFVEGFGSVLIKNLAAQISLSTEFAPSASIKYKFQK